ncbi:hypothetical protein WMF26_21200 [Sorangium sp. So ce185]|uniref:hypothetical protein n=1 Tax=Sorangium sp. So ce185 TaxID=3133287 RepID=UPI003F632B06
MPTLYWAVGAAADALASAAVGAAVFSAGGLVLVDELLHAPASSDSATARAEQAEARGAANAAGDFGVRGITRSIVGGIAAGCQGPAAVSAGRAAGARRAGRRGRRWRRITGGS